MALQILRKILEVSDYEAFQRLNKHETSNSDTSNSGNSNLTFHVMSLQILTIQVLTLLWCFFFSKIWPLLQAAKIWHFQVFTVFWKLKKKVWQNDTPWHFYWVKAILPITFLYKQLYISWHFQILAKLSWHLQNFDTIILTLFQILTKPCWHLQILTCFSCLPPHRSWSTACSRPSSS